MKPDLEYIKAAVNEHPEFLSDFEKELIEQLLGACHRIDELEAENSLLRDEILEDRERD